MIALVCMPFVSLKRPSLALGTLKSCLKKAGLEVTVEYPTLQLAEQVGIRAYGQINMYPADSLLGEWVFAGALFPDHHPDHNAYLDSLKPGKSGNASLQELRDNAWSLRRLAPEFVDRVARGLLAKGYRIVGCSSTFSQQIASLALLKRIRELDPEVITLMGGANCEGVMAQAMVRHFPWVDFVVSGEADELIAPLCRSLLERGRQTTAEALPFGVLSPLKTLLQEPAPRAVVEDMRTVPTPDFDEYFEHFRGGPLQELIEPGLSVETSRGCWWGAKHHCTFCGLNGHGMGFRSRTPEQALEQFHHLAEKYGCRQFMVADNILDMSYFKTVVPALAETPHDLRIFYETKANLKREHLELLARAGIRWIQPGLETLQDDLLRLMDKGTTTLQNLQLLKWCRELGINVTWLMLFGFPGDQLEWYGEISRLLPLVFHLQPPNGLIRIGFHRFSPYFEQCQRYDVQPVPAAAYSAVYPFSQAELMELAYYFEEGRGMPRRAEIAELLGPTLGTWLIRFWRDSPILSLDDDGEVLTIVDTRSGPLLISRHLELERAVLLACEQIRSWKSLLSSLGTSEADLAAACESLQERGLLLRRGDMLLGLAVRGDQPSLQRGIPDGQVRSEPYARVAAGAGIH